jgi:hypothetical protein
VEHEWFPLPHKTNHQVDHEDANHQKLGGLLSGLVTSISIVLESLDSRQRKIRERTRRNSKRTRKMLWLRVCGRWVLKRKKRGEICRKERTCEGKRTKTL